MSSPRNQSATAVAPRNPRDDAISNDRVAHVHPPSGGVFSASLSCRRHEAAKFRSVAEWPTPSPSSGQIVCKAARWTPRAPIGALRRREPPRSPGWPSPFLRCRVRATCAPRCPASPSMPTARAPALARRVSRNHRRRDAARERSGHLGSDLPAARARGVERLDADRSRLPLLPLHRRHHDLPLAQRASRPRRQRTRDPRARSSAAAR